jgi:hypothetical protein
MRENDDALGLADKRAKDCDKAAELLREAAKLLNGADNEPLAQLAESLAPWAERGKYGCVFPERWEGKYLIAEQMVDALSASLRGKGGKATRDGAIVRVLASHFPNEQGFFTGGGYAILARLAALCGAKKATPAYVRSVLQQARRTEPKPAPPSKEDSLLRLFRKP